MTALARFLTISLSVLSANILNAEAYKISSTQILNEGNGSEPRELDPSLAVGDPEGNILDNMFEGLASYHPRTLEPMPGLAESWTISPDEKTYIFKIRKDAKWSDGKDLTAEDFVYSWRRVLDPMLASEYAYHLYHIKNGEEYNTGKIKDAKLIGVSAVDAHTLKVELKEPTPYFLKLTSFRTYYPTPKHVIDKFSGQEWTKEGRMVSCGPYKLEEWKLNRYIKVVQNPYYWDKVSKRMDAIYFYPIENLNTEEKMFLSGKLHITYTVPSVRIPYYQKESQKMGEKANFRITPYLGSYFYEFNTKRKPFNDKRVRRALALTINRKEIVENILHAGQLPSSGLTPSMNAYSHKGNLPETVTPAAIAEAKKLLTEAGFPEGKGFPKFDIHYNTSDDHKKIAVAIQSMWKKNLGIEVGILNQEWKVYLDTQKRMDFDLSRRGWIADYPDPNSFLETYISNGGNNHTGWANKDFDMYLNKAGQTLNESVRLENFHKAESILLEDLPILPIYFYTKPRLVVPRLKAIEDGQIKPWIPNVIDHTVYKNIVFVD